MYCRSVNSISLKSNGSLCCWCSSGSSLTIVQDASELAVQFKTGIYSKIRTSMRNGILPFKQCVECVALEPSAEVPSDAESVIDWFEVETSYACHLKCACCPTNRSTILSKTEHGHLQLSLELFTKCLDNCSKENISIRKFVFQGGGEPLLNPNFEEIVKISKIYYPKSRMILITSGSVPLRPGLSDCGLDEIIFSLDGVDQSTYEPYRIGGSFEQAYNLMTYLAAESKGRYEVTWKYLLFEHNDSIEHLTQAIDMAENTAINKLNFVVTQLTSQRSQIWLDWALLKPGKVVSEYDFGLNCKSINDILSERNETLNDISDWPPFPIERALSSTKAVCFSLSLYNSNNLFSAFTKLQEMARKKDFHNAANLLSWICYMIYAKNGEMGLNNFDKNIIRDIKQLIDGLGWKIVEGYVDLIKEDYICGWLRDMSGSNEPLVVELIVDNIKVDEVVANQSRQDLLDAGKGACGFEIYLNEPLLLSTSSILLKAKDNPFAIDNGLINAKLEKLYINSNSTIISKVLSLI